MVQLRRKACELRSVREANYAKSVLEETLEEISESGTFLALTESVAKSRERNLEKDQVRPGPDHNKLMQKNLLLLKKGLIHQKWLKDLRYSCKMLII